MTVGLRVGCVGAGYFSQFHRDAWARIPGVDLVAQADLDLSAAKATGLRPFSSLAAMLEDEPLDIIDIVTPPPTHLDAINIALKARPKAVICQKPFCTSLDEARRAVDTARQAGIPLIVHENFRFQPWYRAIKQALTSRQIGEVHQITFRLRPGDGQGPRAYLDRQPYFQQMPRFLVRETAVHWIDTFRFLMGAPDWVLADLRRMNPAIAGEDAGHVLLCYADGRRALFDGNRHLDHAAAQPRLTMGEALIEGTEGTINLLGDGSLHLRRFGETGTGETLLAARDWPGFGGDCVYAFQAHVIEALNGAGTLETEAADYLNNLELEALVYRAAETGQRLPTG